MLLRLDFEFEVEVLLLLLLPSLVVEYAARGDEHSSVLGNDVSPFHLCHAGSAAATHSLANAIAYERKVALATPQLRALPS